MTLAEAVINLNGNPGNLPYCFGSTGLMTFSQVEDVVRRSENVKIPLIIEYSQNFTTKGFDKLDVNFHDLTLCENIFVLRKSSSDLLEQEYSRLTARTGRKEITWEAFKGDGGCLGVFLKLLRNVWGSKPQIAIEGSTLFVNETISILPPQWVLTLRRAR